MKFSRHLSTHLTPEWYPQYINYDKMKKMLYAAKERVSGLSLEAATLVYDNADEKFFEFCRKELDKIEAFYREKLSEAKRKLIELKDESALDSFLDNPPYQLLVSPYMRPKLDVDKRKLRLLKFAFSELYLLLILIQNYQSLNCTGFRKILKKHDKLFCTTSGSRWNQENVLSSGFVTDKTAEELIKQVEDIFTFCFENGDRSAAMKVLRVPRIGERIRLFTSFRLGFLMGMCSIITPLIIGYSVWLNQRNRDIPWGIAIRLYRFIFLLIIQVCFTGLNILGWSRSGVNHVLIFEIDPRNHLNYQQVLEIGFFLILLFETSIGCFLLCVFLNRFILLNPLVLFVTVLLLLINPMNFLHRRARRWLVTSFWQTFTPYLQPVQFRHFWLGDQLTSQSLAFADLYFFLVFYTMQYSWKGANSSQSDLLRPQLGCSSYYYLFACLFTLLPHLARFAQCLRRYHDSRNWFPHLVNAGKYFSSFPVVIMNGIRPKMVKCDGSSNNRKTFLNTFVLFSLIEAGYKLAWDLRMDWGLLEPKFRMLRETTVYSPTYVYYLAIVENCLLRFAWLGKSMVRDNIPEGHLYFDTIFSVAEIFRRFVWNFFRLENEHLNNCGQFRAVRDIGIGPIQRPAVSNLTLATKGDMEEDMREMDQISDDA